MTKELSLFVVIFAVVLALPPSLVDAKCNALSVLATAHLDRMYSIIIKIGETNLENLRLLFRSLVNEVRMAGKSKWSHSSYFDEVLERLDDVNMPAETVTEHLQWAELSWLQLSNEVRRKFKLAALSSGVYFFNQVLKTYDEAEATCRNFGLKLAKLEADQDLLDVAAAAPSRGKYWISGIKNHQNCKMIYCKTELVDSSFKYYPCNLTYYFICQVPPKCK